VLNVPLNPNQSIILGLLVFCILDIIGSFFGSLVDPCLQHLLVLYFLILLLTVGRAEFSEFSFVDGCNAAFFCGAV